MPRKIREEPRDPRTSRRFAYLKVGSCSHMVEVLPSLQKHTNCYIAKRVAAWLVEFHFEQLHAVMQ